MKETQSLRFFLRRVLIGIFAVAVLLTPRIGSARIRVVAAAGEGIASKQAEVGETRRRLEDRRNRLHFQELRTQDLAHQLAETNAGIAHVSNTLDVLDGQIHHNERNLAWNQVQLDAAEKTLARHNDALRRRLVDAYERGDLGYVNVLLSSTSFSDFVERWDDIRYLIAANQKTVRERRDAERGVARARAGLESQEAILAANQEREQHAKFQLASLAAQRVQLVSAADADRRSTATEVAHLEDLTAEQEASLEEMIRQRQREEEARRAAEAARLAAESAQRRRSAQLASPQQPPGTQVPAAAGIESEASPGDFSWPASGPITSPFGMRSNPMGGGFEMHPGIDIGAPMGSTITAASSGRVIFAGVYGGYGNAIIIDHGESTTTLYGHCSQIFVANGQDVQRGQAIGAVGSTGESTGPHLHFEVRVNGSPVDPTTRLR